MTGGSVELIPFNQRQNQFLTVDIDVHTKIVLGFESVVKCSPDSKRGSGLGLNVCCSSCRLGSFSPSTIRSDLSLMYSVRG